MLFPADTLATLRRLNAAELPFTASVRRATASVGAGGLRTTTRAEVAALPCRMRPLGGENADQQVASQTTPGLIWLVVFAAGADVRMGDRLHVSGVAGGSPFTRTLDVTGVDVRANEVERRVVCSAAPPAPASEAA